MCWAWHSRNQAIVEAELAPDGGVEIVEITGDGGLLSRDLEKNVAAVAAAAYLRRARSSRGLRMRVHKQMPLASGLGSSGASSAAGAYAANELLDYASYCSISSSVPWKVSAQPRVHRMPTTSRRACWGHRAGAFV